MNKGIVCFAVCAALLIGAPLQVWAAETVAVEEAAVTTLKISTIEDFLTFAENCRLDRYSRDLAVVLENDIDLTGCEFEGIPIFNGTFDGKGHGITGLSITGSGSMQGLFRYLTVGAVVRNLSVSGEVSPGGSRNEIGAIAGRNEGQILNCSFSGTVSGSDYIGGLVGTNGVTAILENCQVTGNIHGDHFVGGIAGDNSGVIRGCINKALVNTTPQQNSVELSDITLDTLTNTESVNTVTDIGGISGISSGVIRDCENHGNVGYPHMGYNIGGIAGTQSGYVADCENRGAVQGRKETGGIVGQMEPSTMIEYTEDTLQILRGQLGTMSGLVNRASGNAQSNAEGIASRIGVLQDQTQTAMDAVDTLLPDPEAPELPDGDTILAAQNTLSATLNAMPGTLNDIASATQTTLYSLTRDLNAISGQINAMGQTLNNASENLGGTITDVSDEDTMELRTGKVENCRNSGDVLADYNAGGIAGAMALENDLDILEDWEQNGEESLNFQSEVRAVILNCENLGRVTGKKQNVGGIVGWQALGLVKNSANTGTVDAVNSDYIGGISGMSTGFIRASFAKCEIYGKSNVGGIAGSATIVTDSLSQVRLVDGKEKVGAILGFAEDSRTEEEEPIARNYYLSVDKDPGAIDGISYAGLAEPLELDQFMSLADLPKLFQNVTIRFQFEDGTVIERPIVPGGEFKRTRIPAVPEKDGLVGSWEGLENADLSNILFDMTFKAVYDEHIPTIRSAETRENGQPVLLAEGAFTHQAVVTLAESQQRPALSEKETLLEVWEITVSEEADAARFRLPQDTDAARVKLLLCGEDGIWEEAAFEQDGSCLVFAMSGNTLTLALVQTAGSRLPVYIACAALVLGALTVLFVARKKRKAK